VTLIYLMYYRIYVIGGKYASITVQRGGKDERIED
jgi:hypothetical protein